MIVNGLVFLLAFIGMEAVAWTAHRFLMHGPLWVLHRDHHQKGEQGFFERNDSFFVVFATPSMVLFYVGVAEGLQAPWFWAGLGISVYGCAYFFIHDIFIHQRFRLLRNANSRYFRAIRRAHKMHHKHLEREDGECFGMLWVPPKYFKEAGRLSLSDQIVAPPKQRHVSGE